MRQIGYLRVHFVCGIFAYHVPDSQGAAGVEFDPAIQSKHFAVNDDDRFVVGNHAFNLTSRKDIFPGRSPGSCLAHLRWLTKSLEIPRLILPEILVRDLEDRRYKI